MATIVFTLDNWELQVAQLLSCSAGGVWGTETFTFLTCRLGDTQNVV